ncbi:MAG: undecaprenyldiphospho-muramoylpentapeptide beta-N-acetylglucosaminyltransferase [Desulfobacca sp.]|nr:undecaprenyldiphospho-muramoylpentapeptide beta-N-acetylglucosaminyltransferase [Desulfobacca sp.]
MDDNVKKNSIGVVIASGGTGGHLFPAVAVAEEFRRRLGAKVSFVTTARTMALEILRRYQFPWQIIDAGALKGQGLWRRLATLAGLPGSIAQAQRVLRQESPDLVLGMGGYSTGPVGVAAWRLGIPLAIHEQNAILGFTNKLLARLADRIFLSFPDADGQVDSDRTIWTGMPLRPEFIHPQPMERPATPQTLLIMGGSQGAHQINLQMLAALEFLRDWRERLHIIHLTGTADVDLVRQGYAQADFPAAVMAFTPDVATYMAQAHLVVCRAGASTVAELTALGRAAILVPYPFAANQHQEKNARWLSEAQAAYLVANQNLTGAGLAAMIKELLDNPEKLADMETRCHSLARLEAAATMVAECQRLICTTTPKELD